METKIDKKTFYTTAVGNIIEHYDKVLFGLIAPFIAPLYFPTSDPIVALILIYLPLGFIARPLGALFWGKIGDQMGRKKVLMFSLLGMSLTMIGTGLLPTYHSIGWVAAFFLHFFRGLTPFFAAGEGVSASLILIESSQENKRDLMSSYYEMSSIVGVLLASFLITWLTFSHSILIYWRYLFLFSGLIGLVGLWFRKGLLYEDPIPPEGEKSYEPLLSVLKQRMLPFLAILFVTGFLCANYMILTKMMNGFIPLISAISKSEMMATHTFLTIIDFLLLPFFGWLSLKIGKERLITWALALACISVFPLFLLLQNPTLNRVLFIRMTLTLWGVAVTAPFNYWAISLLEKRERFRIISLARAIGSQGIGAFSVSLSLFIFHKTHWILSPAILIFLSGFFGICSLAIIQKNKIISKKKKNSFN